MSKLEIATVTSMDAFFRELLAEALRAERLEVQAETHAYILALCSEFARAERLHEAGRPEEPGTPTLAWLFERAAFGPPQARFEAYRHLGDVALVVSGFFPAHLERRNALVGLDYYIDMGRGAYDTAASLSRRSGLSKLLGEMAENFHRLVEVLMRMAEQTTLPVSKSVGNLYERFLRNPGSDALALKLCRLGAVPICSGAVS